jgi:Inorganic pyrophosphatase
MPNFINLPPLTEDGDVHVVVETPRGSSAKFAYDPKLETFILSKSLLTGLTYPHDWGFVPSTIADDGDPLDIMVIHDAATFPGIVLTCRIVGILQIGRRANEGLSGTTACSQYPGARTRSRACAMSGTSQGRFGKSLRSSSSQPTSLRTKNWRSSGGKAPRSRRRRSRTAPRIFRRTARSSTQHQRRNNQAARNRCLRKPSASFARQLRSSASTAASSGLKLSTPRRSSLSAFDLSSRTRLPSM